MVEQEYPAPGGKKYFCVPTNNNIVEIEMKNRRKRAEEAKAEHLLLSFCSFSIVIKRI